jgi:hypothetical protein
VNDKGGAITASNGAANAGTLLLEGGTAGLTSTGTFGNSGTLLVTTGGLQMRAATFSNTGTVTLPTGTALGLTGNLVLGSSSVLSLGVAGTGSNAFAAVRVSGSARLGGALSVVHGAAYTPRLGDTQRILTSASISGAFAKALGGSGRFYSVVYAHTAVTLLTGVPSPIVGRVAGAGARLTLKVSCPAGTSGCLKLRITATVTETLNGRRVVAVTFGRARGSKRHKVVTVASAKVSLAAGVSKVLTVVLNRTGAALLSRYGTLRTLVTIAAGGKVLETRKLTLRGPKHKRGPRRG